MALNRILECFSRDLIPEYCHGLESRVVYTAPPFLVQSLNGCSNRSEPPLPMHLDAEHFSPTFRMLIIYIG